MKGSRPSALSQSRLILLEAFVIVAALTLEVRLVYLQILKHSDFRQMAYRQQFSPRETSPSRGLIEDRNYDLLAMNIDLYNVAGHPDQIHDKSYTASVLARALGMSYGELLSKLSENKSFVWLARQVPYERSQAVENLKLDGIEASREQRRFYPDHDMASHALGFAGLDNQGLNGLEKYFDRFLSGQKGLLITERDARGRVVAADSQLVKASKDGLDLVTTLDRTIQHITQVELQKAFEKYRCKAASAVVMDPRTGEILAMSNYPTFDPNHFGNYPPEFWKNRVVNDEFEPGSTFKLVTALGALEEGVVNEEDRFFCENGAYKTQYGRVVTDHEKHGWLTFREVFGYSSNIGMVKVGAKLGKENLYRYAKRLGFGEATHIDLPGEALGLLREPAKWSGLSLTTIPYGYEVSATPIQILSAYASIANGGVLMKPFLAKELRTRDGKTLKVFSPQRIRRVCSAKTARRLTEMLKWVVEKGTGTAVSIPSYSIAGKTGTAYKFMNGRYSKYNYVSSFVGFVPADNPRLVIYISLDDPRGLYWGGYTAGPVFKEVTKRVLAYDLVPPVITQVSAVPSIPGKTIPSFLGLTKVQCRWLADRDNLKLGFTGKGEKVFQQNPSPGSPSPMDPDTRKILLTLGVETPLGEGQGLMPDLRGKTKRQALALLAPIGVRVNFKGAGVVRAQFPLAGRKIQVDSAIELNCNLPITRSSGNPAGGNS